MGRRLKQRKARGDLGDKVTIVAGQWFSFTDDVGFGMCQADYYLMYPKFIILLECKLTQNDGAAEQMTKLYMPILKMIYGLPVIPVQVCKNLRYNPPDLLADISSLIKAPRHGVWTWHYLAEY